MFIELSSLDMEPDFIGFVIALFAHKLIKIYIISVHSAKEVSSWLQIPKRTFLLCCFLQVICSASCLLGGSWHHCVFGVSSLQLRRHILFLHVLCLLFLIAVLALSAVLVQQEWLDFDAFSFLTWQESAASAFLLHRVGGLLEIKFAILLFILYFAVQLFSFELLVALTYGHNATEVVKQFLCVDVCNGVFGSRHLHVGRLSCFQVTVKSASTLLDWRLYSGRICLVCVWKKIEIERGQLHYS